MIIPAQDTLSFFNRKPHDRTYPASYATLWANTNTSSLIHKVKALLSDYTKEQCIMGSFIGLLFSMHWNRHHISRISQLISMKHEHVDDLLFDLAQIKCKPSGSLDMRIHFINEQVHNIRSGFNRF